MPMDDQVQDSQDIPDRKRHFYCGNNTGAKALVAATQLSRRRSWRLHVKCLENVVLCPGKGLFQNEKFVTQSHWCGDVSKSEEMTAGVPVEVSRIEEAFFVGLLHPCWGHCLVDGTRHLWPLADEEWRAAHKGVKFVYAKVHPTSVIPDNFMRLLEYAGIAKDDLVCISKPTAFGKMLLADAAFRFDPRTPERRLFCDEYKAFFKYLATKACGGVINGMASRTIYLSRGKWGKRRIDFGEQYIERAFCEKYGAESISPECMGFEDFVRTMQETKTLICTEGSLSHNALFLHDGAKLIIVRKASFVNYYQLMINEMKSFDVTYVDANGTSKYFSPTEPWYGPFFLYVNNNLVELLGEPSKKFPWRDYLAYHCCVIKYRLYRFIFPILSPLFALRRSFLKWLRYR